MSYYQLKVRVKETGEVIEVLTLKDFFGPNQYGYSEMVDGKERVPHHIYAQDEVEALNQPKQT
jgi:hypothetical protein